MPRIAMSPQWQKERLVAGVERVVIVVLHLILSILLGVKSVWQKRGWLGLLLVIHDAIWIPNAGFSRSVSGETVGPTERRIMCRRWLRLLEMAELYADTLKPLDLTAENGGVIRNCWGGASKQTANVIREYAPSEG